MGSKCEVAAEGRVGGEKGGFKAMDNEQKRIAEAVKRWQTGNFKTLPDMTMAEASLVQTEDAWLLADTYVNSIAEEDNKIAEKLKVLGEHWDTAKAHEEADKLLCELLLTLGYPKTIEAYNTLSKWYE